MVPPDSSSSSTSDLELSIVMPCLNEADTLATCIQKAQTSIREHNLNAEIIIADNGSDDGSVDIARDLGARVVHVKEKGYGNALMGGIQAAKGRFVIMGDADDSYDFLDIYKFVEKLREGYDLVQGCRLPAGGGTVMPGAMPWSHRWIGNPNLTRLVRLWFGAPIHDVYCGLRGFTRKMYSELQQRCTGMEFATEMIIKSTLYGYRLAEVPITLHPDGRKSHAPHLRTIRDGWRTLRFFMLYSPRWLFLIPGSILILLGMIGYSLVYSGTAIAGAQLDAHTLLFASLFLLMGYQSTLFAAFTKTFAIGENLMPLDSKMRLLFRIFTLEKGVAAGALSLVAGAGLLLWAIAIWWQHDFGRLDYAETMRIVIPGVTLSALGFQTILASFFLSILGMRRK